MYIIVEFGYVHRKKNFTWEPYMEKAPWSKLYIYIYVCVIYKNNDACNSKACTCIYEKEFHMEHHENKDIVFNKDIEGEYPY